MSRFYSWNCQRAKNRNVWHISNCIKEAQETTFIGLQATQRVVEEFGGELEEWSTDYHDVWDVKAPKRTGRGGGVMILAPKGWRRYARAVFYPKEPRLKGRACIVWFSGHGYSVVLVCVYCYVQVQQGMTGGDVRNTVLWNWVTKHLKMLPEWSVFCIMCDGNGHVGSPRKYDEDSPWGVELGRVRGREE